MYWTPFFCGATAASFSQSARQNLDHCQRSVASDAETELPSIATPINLVIYTRSYTFDPSRPAAKNAS